MPARLDSTASCFSVNPTACLSAAARSAAVTDAVDFAVHVLPAGIALPRVFVWIPTPACPIARTRSAGQMVVAAFVAPVGMAGVARPMAIASTLTPARPIAWTVSVGTTVAVVRVAVVELPRNAKRDYAKSLAWVTVPTRSVAATVATARVAPALRARNVLMGSACLPPWTRWTSFPWMKCGPLRTRVIGVRRMVLAVGSW